MNGNIVIVTFWPRFSTWNLARCIYCSQTITRRVDLVNTLVCFLRAEKRRKVIYSSFSCTRAIVAVNPNDTLLIVHWISSTAKQRGKKLNPIQQFSLKRVRVLFCKSLLSRSARALQLKEHIKLEPFGGIVFMLTQRHFGHVRHF